jgi:hypothetical protein
MPIKVKSEETEQEFISRCMSEEKEAFPEQDQRVAVCYSYWNKREEMETEDITDNIDEINTEVSQGFVYANKESEEFATLPTTDCMERHMSAGYSHEYAKMACSGPKANDGQQGGVAMSEEFGRKKFEYHPEAKETMVNFMARCMGDSMVREKKKDRAGRAAFCYSQYQQKYIVSLAKGWR